MARRFMTVATAALALVGFLAACGSSSSGSSGGPSSGASSGSTASSKDAAAWKVGAVLTCTGPLSSSSGPICDATKAWASYTNDNGGINGHKINLIIKDDAGNPATGLTEVHELIEQDKVIALLGSPVTATYGSYLKTTDVPQIGSPPSVTDLLNPNVFATSLNEISTAYASVNEPAKAGLKKFGYLFCAESAVCAQSDPFFHALSTSLGLGYSSAKISSSAPDYTAPCLQMKSAGVDALEIGDASEILLRVLDDCVSQGLSARLVASSLVVNPDFVTHKGAENALIIGPNAPSWATGIPAVTTFVNAMKKYAPKVKLAETMIGAWDIGQVFRAAAIAGKLGDNPTSADVKRGLYALKGETAGGLLAPLTYTKGTMQSLGTTNCYFTSTIKDGKFATTNGGKPVCIDPTKLAPFFKALGA